MKDLGITNMMGVGGFFIVFFNPAKRAGLKREFAHTREDKPNKQEESAYRWERKPT